MRAWLSPHTLHCQIKEDSVLVVSLKHSFLSAVESSLPHRTKRTVPAVPTVQDYIPIRCEAGERSAQEHFACCEPYESCT